MCVERFTLSPFVLSFPTETSVSSVHFNAAIMIRRRVFCTLQVTVSLLRVIIIAFRPIITSPKITAVPVPCKWSITAARRQHRCSNTDCRAVPFTYKLPNTDKRIWSATPNPTERRRQLLGSTLAHLFRMQRNKPTKVKYIWEIKRSTKWQTIRA